MTEQSHKVFVFITGEDIFHAFKIDNNEATQGLIAGMMSDPIVVDVTGNERVFEESGWKFINGKFVRDQVYNVPTVVSDEDDYEVE